MNHISDEKAEKILNPWMGILGNQREYEAVPGAGSPVSGSPEDGRV